MKLAIVYSRKIHQFKILRSGLVDDCLTYGNISKLTRPRTHVRSCRDHEDPAHTSLQVSLQTLKQSSGAANVDRDRVGLRDTVGDRC